MKKNNWSVVSTADKLGLALKPDAVEANHYEVCVAVRHGTLEINVYVDSIVLPVARMSLPVNPKPSKRKAA